MKKGDRIFAGMLVVLLSLAGLTVYHNYSLKRNLRPALPKIDPEILVEQIESGNLSLQEADFYRILGKGPEGKAPNTNAAAPEPRGRPEE